MVFKPKTKQLQEYYRRILGTEIQVRDYVFIHRAACTYERSLLLFQMQSVRQCFAWEN